MKEHQFDTKVFLTSQLEAILDVTNWVGMVFRKNPASNPEQNRSRHSYCYFISRFCPGFFAVFPENSIPSCNIRTSLPYFDLLSLIFKADKFFI